MQSKNTSLATMSDEELERHVQNLAGELAGTGTEWALRASRENDLATQSLGAAMVAFAAIIFSGQPVGEQVYAALAPISDSAAQGRLPVN